MRKKIVAPDNYSLIREVIKAFGVKGSIKRISKFQSIEKRRKKLQKELDKLNSIY